MHNQHISPTLRPNALQTTAEQSEDAVTVAVPEGTRPRLSFDGKDGGRASQLAMRVLQDLQIEKNEKTSRLLTAALNASSNEPPSSPSSLEHEHERSARDSGINAGTQPTQQSTAATSDVVLMPDMSCFSDLGEGVFIPMDGAHTQ